MSTLRTDTLQNAAGTKSVPVNTVVDGSAKAWVNFNGTGTVGIRVAFNVTSITDNGVGDYTVNFTAAMPDTNFCLVSNANDNGVSRSTTNRVNVSAASVRVNLTANGSNTAQDADLVSVAVFR